MIGDSHVNYVLNCTVARESRYTRKKCTTAEAEGEYQRAINLNTVQGEIPSFEFEDGDKQKKKFNLEIKNQKVPNDLNFTTTAKSNHGIFRSFSLI